MLTSRRNYEQLGLKFRLYSAEILFNKGLAQIYLGRIQDGLADMEDARRDKVTDEHSVIDVAIRDRGDGYTVFSIVGTFWSFFPPLYSDTQFSPLVSSTALPKRSSRIQ